MLHTELMNHEINAIRSFNRFYTNILGLHERHLLNSQFTLAEVRVMYELMQTENSTANRLINSLNMDKGYLSRIIKKLETHGLISRQVSHEDARSYTIQMTTEGRQAFAILNQASSAQIAQLTQDLDSAALSDLIKHMHAIKSHLAPPMKKLSVQDISIRRKLLPGDIGHITQLHGQLYHQEQNYGLSFEAYVAASLAEFCLQFDASKDAVWLAEHHDQVMGFLALMHRPQRTAQLRFFIVSPDYRGMGLGKHMMALFMQTLQAKNYRKAYLWTADGLAASASLYQRHGFVLTEEKPSTAFGKPVIEQRYDLHSL